jgi:hypothetical protein
MLKVDFGEKGFQQNTPPHQHSESGHGLDSGLAAAQC